MQYTKEQAESALDTIGRLADWISDRQDLQSDAEALTIVLDLAAKQLGYDTY
jgi:hypothetical protein